MSGGTMEPGGLPPGVDAVRMGGIVERPYPDRTVKEGKNMKKATFTRLSLTLIAILGIIAAVSCKPPIDPNADVTAPTVDLVAPVASAPDVALNGVVTATFSEAMATATMIADNFSLMTGTTAVAGAVSYDEATMTATFTPTALLTASTVYTATITIGATDVAGNALAEAYAWSFTTGAEADLLAPTVISTVPAASATGVAINAAVTATFSEPMLLTSLATAFTLRQGSTGVSGTVTIVGNTATFDPQIDLTANTVYTATISIVAKDMATNALAVEKTWTFTTSATLDTTAPTVMSTAPLASATGVAINSVVTATFSEPMLLSSLASAFTLKQGTTLIPSVVTSVGNTATLTPNASLANATLYTATITVGAKDLANNVLAVETTWTFTTIGPDVTVPVVSSTIPAQSALNVAVGDNITATFSEEMDLATMVGANFTVWKATGAVAGVVTFNQASKTITFNPDADLIAAGANGPVYTARITTVAQDLAGNNLVQDKVWTFTPGSGTRAAVNLLTAGDFVILAQDTITTTGTTAIKGDLGLSPAAASFFTGFSETIHDANNAIVGVGAARYARSSLVSGIGTWPTNGSGKIFSVDYLGDAGLTKTKVDIAVADRITAYNDAAGRATPDVLNVGGGTINAVTFAPGLYTWGTNLEITGDITLTGTATDIWIFRVSGTINLASAKQIILSGGALPQNVFWQATGITTLVTNSVFKGIILGASNIVLQTGSRLDGRALSFTQVTLDAATVNQP